MKITRVEAVSVVVPLHERSWHSDEFVPEGYTYGGSWVRLHWPEFPIVLLRLYTDEGHVGLGEVPKGVPQATVLQYASAFEGRDLWSFNFQELPMETMWFANPSVYAGYEMALYDLAGKALGVPVYRLFGGKFRDRVPVSRCTGRMTPDHAAATARQAVDQGYTVLKMKATADDPVLERLAAIQDAVGDRLQIVVDPNQRFQQPIHLFGLAEQLRDAGIHNVQCYESPFDQTNLDWYRLARQKLTTPLALHLKTPGDVKEAAKHEACDWVNVSGSLVNAFNMATVADAAGMPAWHGSGVDLGIAEAAHTHVCAASRAITLTSDVCGETLRENDLIREPLVIENGTVQVPEAPGLGVVIDDDAIDRYRIA